MTGTIFSKLCALLLLAFIIAVIWTVAIAPWVYSIRHHDQEITAKLRALKRWNTAYRQAKSELQILSLTDLAQFDNHYFTAPNDNLASAQLQTALRAILSAQKATLRTAQVLSKRTIKERDYLAMRLQFDVSFRHFQRILYDLQNHKPLLFVERLSIKPINVPLRPSQQDGIQDRVTVTIEISGAINIT